MLSKKETQARISINKYERGRGGGEIVERQRNEFFLFFLLFFSLSLFHHCFEQFESDPFFFFIEGREGLFVESAGQGCEGGDSNPGKCCSIVSYNGSSPREHSDTVAIAPVRGLQGKSRPPGPGQILLRKQTRVSVILSTANHRPICISRDARYFIDPFRA